MGDTVQKAYEIPKTGEKQDKFRSKWVKNFKNSR